MIVIGSTGKSGTERFMLGSVSEKVVRHAKVPVLVVRARFKPERIFSCGKRNKKKSQKTSYTKRRSENPEFKNQGSCVRQHFEKKVNQKEKVVRESGFKTNFFKTIFLKKKIEQKAMACVDLASKRRIEE